MAAALAELESLLRARKLDRTLTHVRPAGVRRVLPLGRPDLDRALDGGLPRGELSELAGPRSSGRATLMCTALAAATGQGEAAALVDTLDRFDVESAVRAGVACEHLLWIRGVAASVEAVRAARGGGHASLWRAVERAVKAFTLVLESRAFSLAVCDLADVPPAVLRRLPFTTWFRLARLVEHGPTVALLVVPERAGRSAGGVTVVLDATGGALCWTGASDRGRLFDGVSPAARVLRGR